MHLKLCPFCNSKVHLTEDKKTKKFIISCPVCLKSGLKLKISRDSLKSLAEAWNCRAFDNVLLDNPAEMIKAINAEKGLMKNAEEFSSATKPIQLFSNSQNYFGYLVTREPKVIECHDSHGEEIMSYLGLDSSDGAFEKASDIDITEVCLHSGIIRVSFHNSCMMTDINASTCSYNQVTALIIKLLEDKFKIEQVIKVFGVNIVFSSSKVFKTFPNLKSLIMYLDGLIYV